MSFPNIDISDIVEVTNIDASVDRGGWQMQLTAKRDTSILLPMQLIHLWWQGIFGSEAPTTGMLAFEGHVTPLQITFDATGSLATYIATTTDALLKYGWCQGIHFWDRLAVARDNYHEFSNASRNMTMGRIVAHLLGYHDDWGDPPATNPDWVAHTNLVYHPTENPHGWISLDGVTTDAFVDPGNLDGSMRVDNYIVKETDNLWEAIRQIAKNEFFVAYFDKTNKFWYRRHPMFSVVLPDPVMTFDREFSVQKPVVYPRYDEVSGDVGKTRQVMLHAVKDDGSTIHSRYPPSPTHTYGNVHEITYLRCNDPDTLDHWAMVQYLFDNRDTTVHWTAPGLCGLLFELLDRVEITYTGTVANGVHIDWTAKKFWIHSIQVIPGAGFSGKSIFILESERALP